MLDLPAGITDLITLFLARGNVEVWEVTDKIWNQWAYSMLFEAHLQRTKKKRFAQIESEFRAKEALKQAGGNLKMNWCFVIKHGTGRSGAGMSWWPRREKDGATC